MKMFSFTNSKMFEKLIREESTDADRAELLDKPSFNVTHADTGEYIGNLVDISTSGIMIVGESSLTENASYCLNVEFLRDIRVGAVCAWSKDIGTNNFISGFEITDIEQSELSAIEDAIEGFYAEE